MCVVDIIGVGKKKNARGDRYVRKRAAISETTPAVWVLATLMRFLESKGIPKAKLGGPNDWALFALPLFETRQPEGVRLDTDQLLHTVLPCRLEMRYVGVAKAKKVEAVEPEVVAEVPPVRAAVPPLARLSANDVPTLSLPPQNYESSASSASSSSSAVSAASSTPTSNRDPDTVDIQLFGDFLRDHVSIQLRDGESEGALRGRLALEAGSDGSAIRTAFTDGHVILVTSATDGSTLGSLDKSTTTPWETNRQLIAEGQDVQYALGYGESDGEEEESDDSSGSSISLLADDYGDSDDSDDDYHFDYDVSSSSSDEEGGVDRRRPSLTTPIPPPAPAGVARASLAISDATFDPTSFDTPRLDDQ